MNQEPEIRTENPLGYAPLPTLLRRFAVPSIIAMLVSSLYNIVDQFFIGQGVGYLGNAATNVAYPLTTICLAIALLIGIGSASRFSLSLGEGNPERAAEAVGQRHRHDGALRTGLRGGDPALSGASAHRLRGYRGRHALCRQLYPHHRPGHAPAHHYQCHEQSGPGGWKPQIFHGLHAGGGGHQHHSGSHLHFPLQLGGGGGGLGHRGRTVRVLPSWPSAMPALHRIQLQRRHFRLRPDACLQAVSLGLSASLNQLAITFVQIVLNNSLTYYGSMSPYGKEIPLAACGIVMKVNAIMLAVIIGINQGSQPIIGFNYGARQFRRVRDIYRLSITYNLAVSVTAFLLFQLFPAPDCGPVRDSGNALYMEFAVKFMRIFLFMACVNGVQMFSSSFFSAIASRSGARCSP